MQPRPSDARAESRSKLSSGETRFAFVMLVIVAGFNFLDRTLISILQVPIRAELHLSDTQMGMLTGLSFALFYSLFTIPMARLVDRAKRITLMTVALALWSAMTALSGLADGFLTLLICRMGVALGESACTPATLSLLSDYYPVSRRGTRFAIWAITIPVGTSLGMLGGGWVGQELGWRNTFIVAGLAGLALSIPVAMMREPPRGQFDAVKDEAPPSLKLALATFWQLRTFRLFVAGGSAQSYFWCSMQLWLAPFYARAFALPIATVGTFMVLLFGLGGAVGAFLGGVAVDRMGRRDTRWYSWLPAVWVLLALPCALAQYAAPFPYIALGFGIAAVVLVTCYNAPLQTVTQSLVPPRMRGLTSAVILITTNIVGLGLGGVFTGVLSDLFAAHGYGPNSLRYALSISAIPALLASWVFARSSRYIAYEMATQPHNSLSTTPSPG